MSIQIALAALHAAADAIRQQRGITEATVDNDAKSGEIIFTTRDGESYILSLEELPQ